MPQLLAQAQILELSGADARALAQAQFTSDVGALSDGQWQWSAWLDPSGRVRNFFALLLANDERLLAWLPRGDAAAMATRLSLFVFRSKVRIQPVAGYALLALQGSDSPATEDLANAWILDLPGESRRRAAIVGNHESGQVDANRLQAWILDDIAARLPWIADETAEEFTPQALGLERFGAISFDKGCYPGQEIVARLHYRGGNKRHCVRLRTESGAPPGAGERIRIDGEAAAFGRVLYSAPAQGGGGEALAVLPLDLQENVRMKLESGVVARPVPLNSGVL